MSFRKLFKLREILGFQLSDGIMHYFLTSQFCEIKSRKQKGRRELIIMQF